MNGEYEIPIFYHEGFNVAQCFSSPDMQYWWLPSNSARITPLR